jgi:hypothetical protein
MSAITVVLLGVVFLALVERGAFSSAAGVPARARVRTRRGGRG